MSMNRIKRLVLCLGVIIFLCGTSTAQGTVTSREPSRSPRVFLLDARRLQTTKERIRNGDKNAAQAMSKLELEAKKAINGGPFSVVSKLSRPPSGDKHDYMSQAPYFWPNPDTPDHL